MRDRRCTGFEPAEGMSRRELLGKFGMGLGGIALADLLAGQAAAGDGILDKLHHAPRAKRVIYLFQSGAPSQMDLFDHKPLLKEKHGTELPESVRKGQRLTAMSGNQASLPLAGSPFTFQQHGESGAWLSEILPQTATVADDLCFIKSMYTEAINHGPAVTFLQTGSQFPGRPSMGAWLKYGLGSENENLPAFVVMVTKNKGGQPLVSRLWGSGFLPSTFQGVRFRSGAEPILYLNNPRGVDATSRKRMLARLKQLHELQLKENRDPEIESRIAQYELAFRMQTSVPGVMDISQETKETLESYGAMPGESSFANNCLLARRLAENGVRFIQLFDWGWDFHGTNKSRGIRSGLVDRCKPMDQAVSTLIADLKQRGMLDETLVICSGEFGRTPFREGRTSKSDVLGRDHFPDCYSLFMAGGGMKPGLSYGASDELGFRPVENKVHIHDLQATILHALGFDHERLTHRFQGRDYRLTDVHGSVVKGLLA
ncbi:MAG: DUF1501 domain-containing protein [Pirellulaceae bacterium]|nr:DUF1501 domain-containing protein [Pirellulaceae bacterium]